MLTLRRSGLSSPAYRDWLDCVIVEDGRAVGRLYEDRHSSPALRWFWSITVYVNPKLGMALVLDFVEKSHVLDGYCRLVGKGGDEFNLLVSERAHLGAGQGEHADRDAFAQHGNSEHGAHHSPGRVESVIWIGTQIGDVNSTTQQRRRPC
jgi:hypothetical protein